MSEYTTRQIMDMIETNEGPRGLDLSGKRLSEIDLSREMVMRELDKLRQDDPEAEPLWWSQHCGGIHLIGADLSWANLLGANLEGADLRSTKLEGANLSDANLVGARLFGASLRTTSLENANLKDANLRNARLKEATASDAHLEGADLWGAHLEGAELRDTHLEEASLKGAHLEGADLSYARLQRARLWHAHLEAANLRGAHLEGADLSYARLQRARLWHAHLEAANLRGAHLEGADLGYARLEGACLRHARLEEARLWGAHLEGADLWGAHLEGAELRNVHLEEASLWDAHLEGADLSHAHLQAADLRGAYLEGAEFRDANLEEARLWDTNLSRVDLRDAKSVKRVYLYRALLDHTQLTKNQFDGTIGEELDQEWLKAKEAYLGLKTNFEQIGRYDDSSWAYRKERRMEKREAWQKAKEAFQERDWGLFASKTWKVARDLAVEYLCNYGEGVGLVLGWMGVLLFIAGPLIFGIPRLLEWPQENYEAFFNRSAPRRYAYAYLQQFLYVLDAFTTASFAELAPASAVTRVLSGLTAIVGVFLTGLLGFVAGNRIRRS